MSNSAYAIVEICLHKTSNTSGITDRSAVAAAILFAAVIADAALSLSGPEKIPLSGLIAFLALLASVAVLFQNTIVWPAGPTPPGLSAALALAMFGLHPVTIGAVRTASDGNLVASLTGITAGIVICRWTPSRSWLRWASLLPAIPCVLLHRAGAGFAPLLIASIWLLGNESVRGRDSERLRGAAKQALPALVVSIAAMYLHRADTFSAEIAIPGMLAAFAAPFVPSVATGWSLVDGLVSFVVVAGTMLTSVHYAELPGISFGLFWFLVMVFLAPAEPLAAFPGLALAAATAIIAAVQPRLLRNAASEADA